MQCSSWPIPKWQTDRNSAHQSWKTQIKGTMNIREFAGVLPQHLCNLSPLTANHAVLDWKVGVFQISQVKSFPRQVFVFELMFLTAVCLRFSVGAVLEQFACSLVASHIALNSTVFCVSSQFQRLWFPNCFFLYPDSWQALNRSKNFQLWETLNTEGIVVCYSNFAHDYTYT